ncbi:hypothetical protein D3C81_2063390 [compost metagenome]
MPAGRAEDALYSGERRLWGYGGAESGLVDKRLLGRHPLADVQRHQRPGLQGNG